MLSSCGLIGPLPFLSCCILQALYISFRFKLEKGLFFAGEDERQLEIDREREQTEQEAEEPRMPDEREQERAALEREAARDLTTSASLDLYV